MTGVQTCALPISPRIEDYPSLYLGNLPKNAKRTSRMLHLTDLGVVSESLHTKTDFLLPRVEATKDELKDAGAAIFKGEKMLGWLGEVDTIFTKFVRDAVEGGVIIIKDTKNPDGLITLEITKASTTVRPKVENDTIKMKIDVKVSFNLVEKFEVHFSNALNDKYLKSLESAAERYIEGQIKDTIKYVQKEFGADIFHFNVQMKRYEPHLWKQVEDDWEDIFRNLEVDIEVKSKIKQIGTMT